MTSTFQFLFIFLLYARCCWQANADLNKISNPPYQENQSPSIILREIIKENTTRDAGSIELQSIAVNLHSTTNSQTITKPKAVAYSNLIAYPTTSENLPTNEGLRSPSPGLTTAHQQASKRTITTINTKNTPVITHWTVRSIGNLTQNSSITRLRQGSNRSEGMTITKNTRAPADWTDSGNVKVTQNLSTKNTPVVTHPTTRRIVNLTQNASITGLHQVSKRSEGTTITKNTHKPADWTDVGNVNVTQNSSITQGLNEFSVRPRPGGPAKACFGCVVNYDSPNRDVNVDDKWCQNQYKAGTYKAHSCQSHSCKLIDLTPSGEKYLLADKKDLCFDNSAVDITNIDECSNAESFVQCLYPNAFYKGPTGNIHRPKGCYVQIGIHPEKIWFNTRSKDVKDGRSNNARQLCKMQNSYLLINSGSCNMVSGLRMIENMELCIKAADDLGLSVLDSSAQGTDYEGKPYGCVYSEKDGFLSFNRNLKGTVSTQCGDKFQQNKRYTCICRLQAPITTDLVTTKTTSVSGSAANGAKTTTQTEGTDEHYVSKGCPSKYPGKVTLQPADSKHAVRCCNAKGDFCDSDIGGPCHGIKTYENAQKICFDHGLRLCHKHELQNCCGTGCEYDSKTTWISAKVTITSPESIASSTKNVVGLTRLATNTTGTKTTASKEPDDDSKWKTSDIIGLTVGLLVVILVIITVVVVFLKKREKQENGGVFGYMLRGKPDRVLRNRDIKSQVGILPYNTKREVKRSVFKVGDPIGSGNFGSVYKGEIKGLDGSNAKTTIAIKTINGNVGDSAIENFLYEIKIMGYVNPHLNLVSMIGSCTSELETSKDVWLLLELCKHGDLKKYLRENKKKILSESESSVINSRCLVQWSYDIAQGMCYLAENSIMHGDLAARNVLLDEEPLKSGYPVAKVADFGLSKKLYDETYIKTQREEVPWKWMALEYLRDDYFTLASDVWSFAVVVWEIFTFGRTPYGHQSFDEVLPKLEDGYRLPSPTDTKNISNWSPDKLYQGLSKVCFEEDPKKRATFADVLKIIDNELSEEERNRYKERSKTYQSTNAKNYLKLGRGRNASTDK